MSAGERRESVVVAAVAEFGRRGYYGTSTEAIARRVGVSQPYLFRLFPGKLALFKAAAERCLDRLAQTFAQAAEGLSGAEAMDAMKEAYPRLIVDRDLLMMQMQLYSVAASAEDPELGAFVRRRWVELWDLVRSRTGADDAEMRDFFAIGLLINALLCLDLPGRHRAWAGLDGACRVAASSASDEPDEPDAHPEPAAPAGPAPS